jgi:hypothetical protein
MIVARGRRPLALLPSPSDALPEEVEACAAAEAEKHLHLEESLKQAKMKAQNSGKKRRRSRAHLRAAAGVAAGDSEGEGQGGGGADDAGGAAGGEPAKPNSKRDLQERCRKLGLSCDGYISELKARLKEPEAAAKAALGGAARVRPPRQRARVDEGGAAADSSDGGSSDAGSSESSESSRAGSDAAEGGGDGASGSSESEEEEEEETIPLTITEWLAARQGYNDATLVGAEEIRSRGVGEWMVGKLYMKYLNADSQWDASHLTAANRYARGVRPPFPVL